MARYLIENQDRVGLVFDISKILVPHGLNITGMEVVPNIMYLEIENLEPRQRREVERELRLIPGITRVAPVELMPYEEREQRLLALLNSVSEGIIAIDRNGLITIFNPAAQKILGYTQAEVVGRLIAEILSPHIPMLSSLETGLPYDNQEIILNTPKGRVHYITTGRPIKDRQGRTIGVVAALKDMSDVRQLAYSITRPSMITFEDIIGVSGSLRRVIDIARTVARGDSTILIRGESGTGKELFARAVHMESPRRNKPFVPLNCAAVPDTLLESELFGYEEGTFTGAKKGGRQGLFEYASDGTLFLDEIGEMSPHLQAKLLRVLEEGKVRRVGGREENPVNVRIIAATSRPLEEMIRKGDFREDLYYRLNVVPLYLPPLRERVEDIPLLVEHLLTKFSTKMGRTIKKVDPQALSKLLAYPWPGNVRELENVLERAVNLASGDEVRPEYLWLEGEAAPVGGRTLLPGEFSGGIPVQPGRGNGLTLQPVSPVPTPGLPSPFSKEPSPSGPGQTNVESAGGTATPPETPLKEAVDRVERETLEKALAQYGSSRRVGRALGISHRTVLNKMRKYGLRPGGMAR
ncbi:MAG: sigma 54-interacting transcriptional regulator [Firmicutes bacterium]|nr:sigma 54-interacting transcriptional regulator [Bacillota bacterium]MCL5040478.1 sigma 54-interacting transcriptional regulator [Bacillota bacterium]